MERVKKTKASIIPALWKDNIDYIIESELVGANRSLVDANPHLSAIVERYARIPPQTFFQELRSRWNWHNEFYENLLEPALPLLLEPNIFSITPKQLICLRDAYMIGSLVDQATLVISAAIKKHIIYWLGCLPECKFLSTEDVNVLLSLPTTPYPVQYIIDHISYIIAIKEKAGVLNRKELLIKQYHAGDQEIFNGRMRRFRYLANYDISILKKRIDTLNFKDTQWVKHFYLGLERPRIRAIMQSIGYDNNQEKQIARELIGISGFIIRKEVLRYLAETKILPTGSGIYHYRDAIVETALNKLIIYRRAVMDRQVTPFSQHGLTCSAACLTMIAAHFGFADLSEKFEDEVVAASKSDLISGQHYSAVAAKAVSLGMEVILVHSSPLIFDNSQKWLPRDLFESLMAEYEYYLEKLKNHRLSKVEFGASLGPEALKGYLEEGYLVMVAGVISGEVLHAILLTGYNADGYITIDPLGGIRRIMTNHELARFMNTKIGRWIIALRPDQEAVVKLEKSLFIYQEDARKFLV